MFRVLCALLLMIQLTTGLNGQTLRQNPDLKTGSFLPANSLIYRKMTHPGWKSSLFRGNYFVVIQLDRLPGAIQKNQLSEHGIKLQQYLSANAYLAICTQEFINRDLSAMGIRDIFHIPEELKLSPKLRHISFQGKNPHDLIAVTCYSIDSILVEKYLNDAGAEIVRTKIKPHHVWFIHGDSTLLKKLALLPFVCSISPLHLEDVPLNYNNHGFHSVDALSNTISRNLTGRNLVLGIGDNANPSTHVDLAGKLIMRTDEPVADHGTHTAGILAGGGILNPKYAGMAPGARLVTNDFSNILVNSPTYVSDYQMPLTNNSYFNGASGCPGDGEYNALSNYVDSQMISYPKLLHVFAAGNDAALTCTPYPASFATIKSGFQTAKNILTVGSVNNVTYSNGDVSSKGPTSDGRIKPEVAASGVDIVSTVPNNGYATMIGTSMASPTAAGILALITERYRQLHAGIYPDGALLKTLVMNSADDIGNPGPDFTFGFGMVNGRKTVEALEQTHYFSGNVSDHGSQTFTIPSMPAGAFQLKIMLYWPDAPSLGLTAASLVNDLDLQVTDPNGNAHLPMILDPSPAGVNNNAVEGADHLNNVEQVLINNPASGDYTLLVKGSSVPSGLQGFYIAYEVLQPSVTVEYPFGGETWVPGETETIRWSANAGDPNPFTIDYSADGGSSWITIDNAVPPASRSYSWIVPSLFTGKALIRITRNGTGFSDASDYPFTIIGQPNLTATNTCPGYIQLNWSSITGADSYDVMKLSGDTMQVVANTQGNGYLFSGLNQSTEYWFSVRAVLGTKAGRRAIARNIIAGSGACTATALDNDLRTDSLLAPVTGRQFTGSQPGIQRISIYVRNPGALATTGAISYSYQVNGSPAITEVSPAVIPAGSGSVFVFSTADSYDFSATGTYNIKTWVHYAADTIPGNDTLLSVVKNLKNDPLVLSPSFTESFEQALNASYSSKTQGLDSLDRTDFSNSGANGRLNTFFNSGFARTGNRSMILDVTQQGTYAADSMTNTFNLSNYSAADQIWLDLYFKKQSPVAGFPGNQVWIRGNDNAAWIPVKSLSDPVDAPGNFIKLNLDLTGILASASPVQTISSSFQVRCGTEGKTPATSVDPLALQGGGIIFDDFTLTNAQNDVGMRALIQPALKNICSLGSAEKVTVLIRNYGNTALVNIPVTYVVNQDTVTETVAALAAKDSIVFSFNKTVDMSVYQTYLIKLWVSDPIDNYRNNDSLGNFSIQTTPVISQYPYLEGFENNNGYWYSGGQNSSWQWGKPAKQIIHKSANGSNAWVTSLNANYNDNEYSYLYSPCFDLTSLTNPVLSFSHIFETEDDCNCDFHWVEYSTDDSIWTILGDVNSGVNWYDDKIPVAWQNSYPQWHVSSFDIPVISSKVRFRIVMYSDPGTNYEGVGIDDIHVFEKAPVFSDSLHALLSQPVSGSGWIDYSSNGKRIFSINPNGKDLGITKMEMFLDTGAIRDTANQYYGGRSWVIQTEHPATADVQVRYYFTDSEAVKLINATNCSSCLNIEDAYEAGITQYSSPKIQEEDSSLKNNRAGSYIYHMPQQEVSIIPYDNGYYAETVIHGFSEFWLNGGGKLQDHPLAAWLKDFTVIALDQEALLKWASWQETGAAKYVIERSTDSLKFIKIGEMPATQHADSVQSYQFPDPSPVNGNNYYRLVLYFQNGDSLISPVKKLLFEGIPTEVKVYPNPTDGYLTIKTPSPCREVQIFDALGRLAMDKAVQGYSQEISLAAFSKGVYFLKLFTDSGNKLIKLEKR